MVSFKMQFSTCHRESLRSQLDRCQIVCRTHSCWGDRLPQLQKSPAIILRLPALLHYTSFGVNLVIQLMGRKQKTRQQQDEERLRSIYKSREAVVLRLPPFPRQITGVTLNFTPSSVSPDIPSLLSEREKPEKRPTEVCSDLRFLHCI